MGKIINDKSFLNDNIFKFEKRLESQYSIFTEKNPTFVTYYHINNINTTTDSGLLNVDRVLGTESPLKFQEIKDFPIYGIEQIKIDLSDEEEGLTGGYEGDGIILPNTIKPLPNDFFTISYLGRSYLFMVTAIDYDTIKSNNYYKINFTLRSTDLDSVEDLNKQVIEKYNCIFKNIGTEDNCIIREDAHLKIQELIKVYESFVKKYIALFYNKKYNSFLLNLPSYYLYDKFVSHFIQSNNLLNDSDQYNTIVLSNEDYGEQFPMTYDYSIYKIIELKEKDKLRYVNYEICPITYQHSIFLYYNLHNIRSVIPMPRIIGSNSYVPDYLIDDIKHNITDNLTIIEKLIVNYFNDSIESVFQINIDELNEYRVQYDLNNFILVPILLFVLKYYINNFFHI